MLHKTLITALALIISGCVVMPQTVESTEQYQCGLSSDKKTLKIVNLTDGDASFYRWHDEVFSIISMPSSAIVSSVYVAVNNIYHIGEKQIRCSNT